MDTHQANHHVAFLCDGSLHNGHGGSWIGHVLPGMVLSLWGLHWFLSVCTQHLKQHSRTPQYAPLADSSSSTASHNKAAFLWNSTRSFHSATHRVFILEAEGLHVEAWLKVVLPCVAICLEFSLSGTRYLRCPPGSAKSGELDVTHMNSWSHATNYPPIILSGLVDLIHAYWRPLPAPLPHASLSSAFSASAFLMLSHTKAEPLDGLVHHLLGLCMAAVAAAVMGDGVWRGSFAWGAAKSLALMMEGAWFFAVTHIMFSNDTTWAASYEGDMTRIMFTPVLFTWIFIGLTFFMLLLYLGLESWVNWHSARLSTTTSSMVQLSSPAKRHTARPVADVHCRGVSFHDMEVGM